ncbi:PepSY domain-containing protein [Shewanella sp.]|uniref:PepSY domain-containing protein n=1 Tax=Shewanella sp. TaxID=50422 RepID=UPI003A969DF0
MAQRYSKSRYRLFSMLILLAFSVSPCAPVLAKNHHGDKEHQTQLRVRSSNEAAQIAQRQFGGKVLKVQKRNNGYVVKLISEDGRIMYVNINAVTGAIE